MGTHSTSNPEELEGLVWDAPEDDPESIRAAEYANEFEKLRIDRVSRIADLLTDDDENSDGWLMDIANIAMMLYVERRRFRESAPQRASGFRSNSQGHQ